MATTIRELMVAIGVDADTREVRAFDAALSAVKTVMFATVGAAVAVAGAVIGVSVATARAGDEAAKAAQRVGVNVEAFQELAFAAKLAGADMTAVEVAFRRQAVSARDAAEKGIGPAADAYRKIGVEVRDVNGIMKSQIQIFTETAEGMKGLKTDGERLAIANDLLGRGGAKLLPLLNQGAAGIAAMRLEAQELGGVMSGETTKAAEDFEDVLVKLQTIMGGLRAEVGGAFLPVFIEVGDSFISWFKANRLIIRQRMDIVFRRISDAILFVRDGMRKADTFVRERLLGWRNLFKQTAKVIGGSLSIVTGLGFLRFLRNAAVAAKLLRPLLIAAFTASAPMLLLLGTLAAIGLVIDDLIVFSRGGESAIGQFLSAFGAEEETRENFNAFLAAGKVVVLELSGALLEMAASLEIVETLASIFGATWENVGDILADVAEFGIGAMNDQLVTLTGGLGALAKIVRNPREQLLLLLDTIEGIIRSLDEISAQLLDKLGLTLAAGGIRRSGRAGRAGGGAAAGVAAARQAIAGGAGVREVANLAANAAVQGAVTNVQVGAANVVANITGTVEDFGREMIRINQDALTHAMAVAEGGNR